MHSDMKPALLSPQIPLLQVERAVNDWRVGLPVVVRDTSGESWLAAVGETYHADWWNALRPAEAVTQLVLPPERLRALGLVNDNHQQRDATICALTPPLAKEGAAQENPAQEKLALGEWLEPLSTHTAFQPTHIGPAPRAAQQVLALLKATGMVPALLVAALTPAQVEALTGAAAALPLQLLDAAAIAPYMTAAQTVDAPLVEAALPLSAAPECRVIAFRPRFGGMVHLALCVGEWQRPSPPPLVRIHSACLTGDVLGSLRCDCGEQLTTAVRRMAEAGGGILLYLNQEGRGLGIVNKLRAYQWQDRGLDTVDANQVLGFGVDERDFTIAAAILRALNIHAVRLLTNNPHKEEALSLFGISVTERLPLAITPGEHNARYLATKAVRLGHQFE